MRGAILREFNKIQVEDLPMPVLGYDEALIRVEYAGICGTDVHIYSGNHPTAKPPVILGHELVGTLVEVNSTKGTDLKVGEKVTAQPTVGCGTCDMCIQGRDNACKNLKILGILDHGCFAEYIKVPLKKVFRLPEGIDMQLAALIEPLAVAVHDVRRSNIKVGQTAFIVGGGPIGILIAMVARMNGATKVVISELMESRIQFIKDMGFDVVNPKTDDMDKRISELTCGKGFDVIYEVSGTNPGVDLAVKACKAGGNIVLVGIPKGKYSVDLGSIILEELNVMGVRIHSQVNFGAAIDIIKAGTLNDQLVKLITNVFPLDEIQEAMKFSIEDKDHFKVLLKI